LEYALAQTRDGTLWVGGYSGLARFDGAQFVRYPEPGDEPLPSTYITELLSSPDGGLWIGFEFGGICLLRDGHVVRYGEHEGIPAGSIRRLEWDRDGALWIATTSGLVRLRDTRVEKASSEPIGDVTDLLVDRAGNTWIATVRSVLVRAASAEKFRLVTTMERSWSITPRVLAESPDGHVWVTGRGIVIRLDPNDPARNRAFHIPDIDFTFFDTAGNAWFEADGRIKRWQSSQLNAALRSEATTAQVETLSTKDDLSHGAAQFLEDREHNVWIGHQFGMDRFSHSNVVPSLEPCPGMGYALAAGDAGALWAACEASPSPSGHLLELRDGRIVGRRASPNFVAAYRDPAGTVWFGGPEQLGHLEGDAMVTSPLPEKVRGFDVQALATDANGALWVSVVHQAVYRVSDGQWSEYGGLDAMPRGAAIVETADGEGGIWFGYPDNRVAHLRGGHVQVFGAADGLDIGNITAIHKSGQQVWAGGDFGLARFAGTRFVTVLSEPNCLLSGASGIAATKDGDLWLNAKLGIAHLTSREIERIIREPSYRAHCETFDYLDGVPGPPVQIRPTPSAVATTDGRVWFEMNGGTISIDTTHLVRNALAPPVTIWSINSAGHRYPNKGTALVLPIHTTNLQIDYSAGSYTIPERIRFRYKLEGSDRDWQDGGARREAIYTNLGPGKYLFRVTAANDAGVWNDTGTSIDFTIAPAFYQAGWFHALCALLCFGMLALLYRMRIGQVRAQTGRLLGARLAERERIARELHDTLLQGMQGLIWRFQAAADRIPSGEPARELMERSLERADRLMGEGRDRIKDLRAAGGDATDLAQALAIEGEALALAHATEFRLTIEGAPRDLHPIVREEVFLIAREALGNSFRHSGAKHIEAQASYDETALRIRVRDDGRGISTDVLTGGKPNRFGLVGMRERAVKLGAQLEIWSSPGAGTEIDLRVPAKVAYRTAVTLLRSTWWRRTAWLKR
jgi:signal transduction histidine kinase/ligand-binding sensor domain-containing protein